VNTTSQKPTKGISPDVGHRCILVHNFAAAIHTRHLYTCLLHIMFFCSSLVCVYICIYRYIYKHVQITGIVLQTFHNIITSTVLYNYRNSAHIIQRCAITSVTDISTETYPSFVDVFNFTFCNDYSFFFTSNSHFIFGNRRRRNIDTCVSALHNVFNSLIVWTTDKRMIYLGNWQADKCQFCLQQKCNL